VAGTPVKLLTVYHMHNKTAGLVMIGGQRDGIKGRGTSCKQRGAKLGCQRPYLNGTSGRSCSAMCSNSSVRQLHCKGEWGWGGQCLPTRGGGQNGGSWGWQAAHACQLQLLKERAVAADRWGPLADLSTVQLLRSA
jgi:hypothetical protein